MTAFLVVRAEVPDAADRQPFDRWYATEHLRDAVKAFGVRQGWRGWSRVDPAVHYAFYEFDSVAAAQAMLGSDATKALIAEFDRVWGGHVTRSRDIVERLQGLPA